MNTKSDHTGAIISYEEYHPFGTTSYRSGRNEIDVSLKRYKYVFKELDNETGLYYYGMRYYAGWIARFISVDPKAEEFSFQSPYVYAGNNPIKYIDFNGENAWHPDGKGNLIADAGDIDDQGNIIRLRLENYLDEIGVNYTEEDMSVWEAEAYLSYDSPNGATLTSSSEQFNNLVGKYLINKYNSNKSWGYKDLGGNWSCSPTVAKRVGLAVQFVYGKKSNEYKLISSQVAYNGFQNNYGKYALLDLNNDGIRETSGYENWKAQNAGEKGYTREMANLTIVGPLLYSNTGYSLTPEQIWNGKLKQGAVLGLTYHTAIFIKYYKEEGKIMGMYIWDDHNEERLLYKGNNPMPTKGGNFY